MSSLRIFTTAFAGFAMVCAPIAVWAQGPGQGPGQGQGNSEERRGGAGLTDEELAALALGAAAAGGAAYLVFDKKKPVSGKCPKSSPPPCGPKK